MLLDLFISPISHHARQRNANRTYFVATAAKCRRIGQVSGFFKSKERRRDYGPDRPRIDRPIGMAADGAKHRTMVHTRTAPNASKHIAEFRTKNFGSTIVEQHNMVLFGDRGRDRVAGAD